MTLVEGEELQRLWALVSELSSQLTANRQLCHSLQAQADELKGQALHTGTGYTLRRFNLDITKEKFESDLEKLNSQLVIENQSLSHENKQINLLLREYENTLESVMSKFRSFSHATQQHTLSLTSHYETLLATDAHRAESASLHESTSFSNALAHLGGLVRLALREVEGEGVGSDDEDESKDIDPFEAEGYRVGSPSGIGPSSHSEPSSSKAGSGKKAKTAYGSAPSRDPRWYGTGGYTGLQGDPEAEKADKAMQWRTEEERLRRENETLREMLRISADITPEVAREFGIQIPAPAPTPSSSWSGAGLGSGKLSLGKARGSRKSIVEASAEAKAAEETEAAGPSTSVEEPASLASSAGNVIEEPAVARAIPGSSAAVNEAAAPLPLPTELHSEAQDVSSIASTSNPLSHAVEGAGGPPQLSPATNEGEGVGKPGSGIVVASQIEEQASEVGGEIPDAAGQVTDTGVAATVAEEEEGAGQSANSWVDVVDGPGSAATAEAASAANREAIREKMLAEAEEALSTEELPSPIP